MDKIVRIDCSAEIWAALCLRAEELGLNVDEYLVWLLETDLEGEPQPGSGPGCPGIKAERSPGSVRSREIGPQIRG